jgi:hypothetical protein
MDARNNAVVPALTILALTAAAAAQVVSPAVMVSDPLQGTCSEPAIVASPKSAKMVLVDWIESTGVVQYATSTNGGLSFSSPQQFVFNMSDPCVQTMNDQSDPMVAASRATGDLYAGILAHDGNGSGWFYVGRQPFGSAGPLVAVQAVPCGGSADKGFAAIGPASNSPSAPEIMDIGYSVSGQWRATSSTATPVGSQWPSPPVEVRAGGQSRSGRGVFPVIVPFGTFKSRVIFSYSKTHSVLCPYCAPPVVTYSDDGQSTWHDEIVLDRYGPNNQFNVAPVEPPVSVAGMPGNWHYTLPSMALDPNNPEVVYVVFPGGADTSATNVDLFVARGVADPLTGELVFTVYRVTGPQLGESSSGPYDLWLPSIAIDGLGGINLLFWRTNSPDGTPPEQAAASVRYARFASFSQVLAGQNASFWQDLSAQVHPTPGFGDYFMLTAVGCGRLYAAWVTDQSGTSQVYVNRINASGSCDVADADSSGLVNVDDALAFTTAFAGANPAADVNRDQHVDAEDAAAFYGAWNSVPHQP